jgi:hypothetical protein
VVHSFGIGAAKMRDSVTESTRGILLVDDLRDLLMVCARASTGIGATGIWNSFRAALSQIDTRNQVAST